MADRIIAAALEELHRLHARSAEIVSFLDAALQFDGSEELPRFLTPQRIQTSRSGETTGPTVEMASPVATSSAKAACSHVVGEGQEQRASASPANAPLSGKTATFVILDEVEENGSQAPDYEDVARPGKPVVAASSGSRSTPEGGSEDGRVPHATESATKPTATRNKPEAEAPIPELPASDGVKGEAPASSPSLGVSSRRLPASTSSEAAPAFSGKEKSALDHVLDIYAAEKLSLSALAARARVSITDTAKIIVRAQGRGEERARKGDDLRGLKQKQPAKIRRVIVPEGKRQVPLGAEERPLPKTGAAVRKPLSVSMPEPAASAPQTTATASNLQDLGIVQIDEVNSIIVGPTGQWQAYKSAISVVKRLAKLKPDQALDTETLRGPTNRQFFLDSIPIWTRSLHGIGVNLIRHDNLFRIEKLP